MWRGCGGVSVVVGASVLNVACGAQCVARGARGVVCLRVVCFVACVRLACGVQWCGVVWRGVAQVCEGAPVAGGCSGAAWRGVMAQVRSKGATWPAAGP